MDNLVDLGGDIDVFTFRYEGVLYEAKTEGWIIARFGQAQGEILMLDALKLLASDAVRARAESFRGKFVNLTAGKLVADSLISIVATRAQAGDQDSRNQLGPIAAAQGNDIDAVLVDIVARRRKFEGLAIMIAAFETTVLNQIAAATNPPHVVAITEAAEIQARQMYLAVLNQGG